MCVGAFVRASMCLCACGQHNKTSYRMSYGQGCNLIGVGGREGGAETERCEPSWWGQVNPGGVEYRQQCLALHTSDFTLMSRIER